MMSVLNSALVSLIGLMSLPTVFSYPSGAPSQACSSMTPEHRNQFSQTGAPPFAIRLNQTKYRPGVDDAISVSIISACNNEAFQGFMVQARHVNSTNGIPFGYFDFANGVKAVSGCGSFGQAMTHRDVSEKRQLSLVWIANQVQGDVVMVVTFLKNYGTFWVKVFSEVIIDATTTERANTTGATYPTRTICDAAVPPNIQPPRTSATTTSTTSTTTTTTTTTTTPDPTTTTTTPVERTPQMIFTQAPPAPADKTTSERTTSPARPTNPPTVSLGPMAPYENVSSPISSTVSFHKQRSWLLTSALMLIYAYRYLLDKSRT